MTNNEIVNELGDIADCVGKFSASTVVDMIEELVIRINQTKEI